MPSQDIFAAGHHSAMHEVMRRSTQRLCTRALPACPRRFSDRIPFRERSETASIAVELSMQPWEAFRPDGVIMFSDILTPLPALGIEFDVIKGKGPVIATPVRRWASSCADALAAPSTRQEHRLWYRGGRLLTASPAQRMVYATLVSIIMLQIMMHDVLRSMDAVRQLRTLDDPDASLPFIREILSTLRQNVGNQSTVLGFIGAPWTLAAYAMEGAADRRVAVIPHWASVGVSR